MPEKTYRLSDDLSIAAVETLYREVVLKQDFYGHDYGAEWSLVPFTDMAQLLVATLQPRRHLDIGCGPGLLVQAMRAAGVDSSGIDFSEALINRAEASVRPHLQVATAEDWLQKASMDTVDLVSYMEVFEHIPIRILEDILTAIRPRLQGSLLLTIPSYGVDATFGKGMVINDSTPSWKRDMAGNLPFRNIVLEDERPHLGHITLASWRWWSEFFLAMGFGRHYDRETRLATEFGEILGRHGWHPYLLEPLAMTPSNLVEQAQHLTGGWHAFEAGMGGRWTDGYAQAVIAGDAPAALELEITLPPVNIIRDFPVLLAVEQLSVADEWRLQWQPTLTAMPTVSGVREQPLTLHLPLPPPPRTGLLQRLPWFQPKPSPDALRRLNVWRITLASPQWNPRIYDPAATDERPLGVFVHRLEAISS